MAETCKINRKKKEVTRLALFSPPPWDEKYGGRRQREKKVTQVGRAGPPWARCHALCRLAHPASETVSTQSAIIPISQMKKVKIKEALKQKQKHYSSHSASEQQSVSRTLGAPPLPVPSGPGALSDGGGRRAAHAAPHLHRAGSSL